MASEGPGEKTEKPTAKRLADAAKNGDILQSRELATAMVVMAGIATMAVTGPEIIAAIREMLREGLRIEPGDIATFAPEQRAAKLISLVLVPIGAILFATFAAAVASPALLGSLGFRAGAFAPKFSKLNPASGIKRIFGPQGLTELVKSIAKVVLMGSIGGYLVWERTDAIRGMGKLGLVPAVNEIGHIFVIVALALAGSMFLIAGIDVPAQMFQRSKRLNMSKQEIRDEHKESEGSPEAKGAIRRRQMETMAGSIRKAVSEASVILTNPTHFAVALRYNPGRDLAPVVLARGADEIARTIRECGNEASVPVLQYPELTRAIYYTSHTGQVIDERLFLAVATVLAFVFRIENSMASQMDRPYVDLPDGLHFDADGQVTR
jgi:flagellar biosynthetic protein FlhB